MMIRFKIAVFFMFAILAGCIIASPPEVVFDNNREKILSGTFASIGGYCFGTGSVMVMSGTSQSAKIAAEKSVLQATVNVIVHKALVAVDWPSSVSDETKRVLQESLARRLALRKSISGVQTVFSEEYSGGRFVSVVSLPDDQVQDAECTIEQAEKILLDPHWLRRNFKKNAPALYEFYLARKKLPTELVGTAYADWSDEQLDMFCGIPRVVADTNAVPCKVEGEARGNGDGVGDRTEFTGNVNETIGF